jgi:hypothetical protein
LREVHFVNVHLLLLDEIQKEIQRTFEDLELDFVIRHGTRAPERGGGKS